MIALIVRNNAATCAIARPRTITCINLQTRGIQDTALTTAIYSCHTAQLQIIGGGYRQGIAIAAHFDVFAAVDLHSIAGHHAAGGVAIALDFPALAQMIDGIFVLRHILIGLVQLATVNGIGRSG